MPKVEEFPSPRTRARGISPLRPEADPADEELSENAIRAIEEGRADHAAGHTLTMDEIKRESGVES